MGAKIIRSSCLCGQVKFECSGPATNFNLCHCTMCQKFHGTMLGAYVWFKRSDFKITLGIESVYESSEWASRSFCNNCGSSLRYIYKKEPEIVFIVAGILDDDPEIRPDQHIFVKDKCCWYEINDDLPQVQSWSSDEES